MFLAALMVLSVSAGTVAFAGTAAADASTITVESADDVPIQQDEVTQEFELSVEFTDDSSDTITINGIPAAVSVENIDVRSGNTSQVTVTDTSTGGPSFELQSQVDGTTTTTVYVSLEHDTSALGAGAITTGNGASFDFVGGSATGTATFDIVAGNDAQLNSGSTYWQGQESAVFITGTSTTVAGVTIEDDDQIQIREYDTSGDDPQIGSLEDEFSLENGYADINTDDLDGEYVVTPASDSTIALEITNGEITDGFAENNLAGNTVAWEVTTQDLSIDFDEDSVNNGETDSTSELDLNTNRGSSDIEVTADGLDDQELLDIFSASAFNAQPLPSYDDDSDDTIVLKNIGDVTEDTEFEDIEAGEYEFTFEVTDTTASDSGTVEVTEADVDAGFTQGVTTETAGDIANITVSLDDTDSTFVQFGDEDAGFVDILYLEDDDDDDEVSFRVNLRTLGTKGADQVYDSEDDIVESQIHGGIDTPDTGPTFWDEEVDSTPDYTFNEYLEELDLIDNANNEDGTDQLTRPLQPAEYDLTAASDGQFIINDDGESTADEELDSALLELTTPGIEGITIHKAPADNADQDDTVSELVDSATAIEDGGEIAIDDRLVVQVQASGLYGATVEETGDFDTLEDGTTLDDFAEIFANINDGDQWDGEGMNLVVEAEDATGNQDATTLNYDSTSTTDAFVLFDEENNQFFIIADTSASNAFDGDVEDGSDFSASLEYETDDEDLYEFDYGVAPWGTNPYSGDAGGNLGNGADAAYPFLSTDSTQSEETTFSMAERDVSFDNVNNAGVLQVPASSDATISGTTNVAPGSDAEVRVSSTEADVSFRTTASATIDDDGTFSTTFDFSEQSAGDLAETSFRVSGTTVDTVDTELVESVQTETPEPGTETPEPGTETPEPGTETPEPGTETPEPGTETPEPGTETPTSTPGFGVVVALTALIAAALLAIRREN
ncbi:BGTF surface domain-containing protein [Halobellus inordinatus]|uniref:BGTF surface domain-containing protein n=1 Tax=Halobellus inordinatus TaxID=1126236 RepID=UPI0021157A72|nr:BGTF surface domain-containing protein [Halobellus ramosii]